MKGTELYRYCVERDLIDPASHELNMNGCWERSTLTCFTEKERNVRYNIFLLGGLAAKLPNPLDKITILLIKVIPPNIVFKKIRYYVDQYYLTRRIFELKKEAIKYGSEYNKFRRRFIDKT